MTAAAKIAAACLLLAGCTGGRADFALGPIEEPGNTQVPLPPGDWKELASNETSSGNVLGGGINNDHSRTAYYARIEGGHIVQLVYVRTSAGAPSPYGYGTGLSCLNIAPNDYVYYADPRSGSPNAIDCVKVTGNRAFRAPTAQSTEVYRQAWKSAEAYGGLPRYSVQVEIAQAHSNRFQDYYAYYFPDQSPTETRAADWTTTGLTPAHRTFTDGIVAWAKDFREAVRLGTEYRL